MEIDPQQTNFQPNDPSSSDYYPCGPWISSSDYYNPWQVVWYHSSYHLDVGQQAFNYQANSYDYYIDATKYYDFKVIDGQGLCHINENYIDTINGNYIPPTNPGYNLVGIKGSDMIGELAEGEDPGNLPLFQGIPTRGGFRKYTIVFDQPGDVTFTIKETGTNEVISYHTTIVVPDYSLNVSISNEIPHGEEESIIAEADILNCLGMGWMFFNGGGYGGSYNYEITGGLEYATLVHVYFDEVLGAEVRETGTNFFNIDRVEEVLVWMNGEEPDSIGLVQLNISSDFGVVNKQLNVLRNDNYPLRITIVPDSLVSGDTADVVLKNRVSESPYDEPVIYETFPEDQYFNVSIIKGAEFADIYTPDTGETGDEFELIPQGFKLIINPGIDSSDVEIKLRVSTKTGDGGFPVNPVAGGNEKELESMKKDKDEIKRENAISSTGDGETDIIIIPGGKEIFGIGKAVVNPKEEIEILLGETKYFQAKYNSLEEELKIEEIEPDENGVPQQKTGTENGWEWLTTDVWGNNPISVVKCDTCGKKMGVYWEKGKPVWDGNTNRGSLATGLIRTIGRFWHKDSTYIVKLNTDQSDDSIMIKVVKPNKLGTTYATAKDVSNNDINIDSLCITKGGELGIPPQFIKGQMRRETSAHYPFNPTYLYEPWTTQFNAFKNNPSLYNNSFYIKKDAINFNPPVPQNHTNVKDYHYPDNPVSVWDMIDDYSTIVHTSPQGGWRKYGERRATKNASKDNGVLYFYGVYKTPKNKYEDYKKEAYIKYKVNKHTEKEDTANNEARENFIKYFKNEWNGGITGGTKGLKNIKAQTRIAASYGLLQLTYPTAIGSAANYPDTVNNLPEELLESESLKWPLKLLTNYLDRTIQNEINTNGNWTLGFEQTYKKVWKKWNKYKRGYPDEVLDFSNEYKPSK